MISTPTTEDIYVAVEDLIKRLASHETSKLAAILDHRMHKVAWTTCDELIEELYKVVTNELTNESSLFNIGEREQIRQLLDNIKKRIEQKIGSPDGILKL